jgi:hypothetical protein
MKKVFYISIISLLLLSLDISAKKSASTDTKTEIVDNKVILKGIVFDKLTNETLAGAIVTANGQKVYTDLDGNFIISNLCGEKCQLKISLISYLDQTIEIDTQNTPNVQVKLQQR